MRTTRTQVGIVGAGPAGLLLSHLLHLDGIDSVVLESRGRSYVEQRVRAGVLEHGTTELLDQCGVGARMRAEGLVHHGIELRFERERHRVPLSELAGGRAITVYGQQEVVKDLIAARLGAGGSVLFDAECTAIDGSSPSSASISYRRDGEDEVLECDIVAGCDGFHGVTRSAAPEGTITALEHTHPFAWLGILAQVAPSTEELVYCRHESGFAMHSMRSAELSRLYLQVGPEEQLDAWPDERIWEELRTRFATGDGWALADGPVIEKGITAMKSFVVSPMQWGRVFLAGDSAHIVPPTGAKGMNLAIADVKALSRALVSWYASGDETLLDGYSASCLRRVWRAQEFSTYMTTMLHPLPGDDFGARLALSRLRYAVTSRAAGESLAENYVDLSSL
ncbi:MAG TPA: 4-hydroxybenzoate 3-monooxygenase [Acidimicrobiales bacterium]|nr:4-hydroxybenzoate 3-monooxygenase [Acidimicrobiales bacterium]